MLVHQLPKSASYATLLVRHPYRPPLPWSYPSFSRQSSLRTFNSSSRSKRDRPTQQSPQKRVTPKVDLAESVKPESVQKPLAAKTEAPPKTDAFLAEQTVSNKEQRKADWAIMKEMARYLWPKVGLFFCVMGYLPDPVYRVILGRRRGWERHWLC